MIPHSLHRYYVNAVLTSNFKLRHPPYVGYECHLRNPSGIHSEAEIRGVCANGLLITLNIEA